MPVKKSESDPTPAVSARGSGTPLQRYGWGLAIGAYAVSLGLLSGRLSLWVDEVLQFDRNTRFARPGSPLAVGGNQPGRRAARLPYATLCHRDVRLFSEQRQAPLD